MRKDAPTGGETLSRCRESGRKGPSWCKPGNDAKDENAMCQTSRACLTGDGVSTYGPLVPVLGSHVVGKVGDRAQREHTVLEEEGKGGVEDRALWFQEVERDR